MSLVADRYAKALLDLAISNSTVEEYQNEFAAVAQIYKEERDLVTFLFSPQKNLATKKALITHVFSGSISRNILNLLLLLLEKGRINSLPDIYTAYEKMADEYRKILNISVITALPLSKEQLDGISEKFKAIYHASSVKITVETDNALVGGIRVVVGDKLYDGTVKGKLLKMQSALT